MNTYLDSTVRAEIDRRFELAGVDPTDRHAHHRFDLAPRPLRTHPLAAFVARLVGGSVAAGSTRRSGSAVPAGRPRHP